MTKLSARYSQALFEAIVSSNENPETIKEELTIIDNSIFKNPELNNFFLHPNISNSDKKNVLVQTFENKISTLTLNFLLTLLEEKRLNLISEIVEIFNCKIDELNNIKKIHLISAIELDDDIKEKIINKLEEKLNSKIKVENSIDEQILAGFIVEFEDKIIDLSLKKKLETFKKGIN